MNDNGADQMTLDKRLMEELDNVAATGRGGLFPGDTITHASAYELERRGMIARNAAGDWVVTASGERLLAECLPAIDFGSDRG